MVSGIYKIIQILMAPKELVLKKGKDLVVDSPSTELDIVD